MAESAEALVHSILQNLEIVTVQANHLIILHQQVKSSLLEKFAESSIKIVSLENQKVEAERLSGSVRQELTAAKNDYQRALQEHQF